MKLPRRVSVGWKIVCFGWGWEVKPWYFPKEEKVSKGLLQENCNKNILLCLLPTWKPLWILFYTLHSPFLVCSYWESLPSTIYRLFAELKSIRIFQEGGESAAMLIFLMKNWKPFSNNFLLFCNRYFFVENNPGGKFTLDLVCCICFLFFSLLCTILGRKICISLLCFAYWTWLETN